MILPLSLDAAFGVRSPSDSSSELRRKMQDDLKSGSAIVVWIDADGRRADVYREHEEIRPVTGTVDLSPELAGFVLDLGRFVDDRLIVCGPADPISQAMGLDRGA